MHLRPARPLWVVGGHRGVAETVEVARRLRLHPGVGPSWLPHPTKVAAALDDVHVVPATPHHLGSDEAADARADHENLPDPTDATMLQTNVWHHHFPS